MCIFALAGFTAPKLSDRKSIVVEGTASDKEVASELGAFVDRVLRDGGTLGKLQSLVGKAGKKRACQRLRIVVMPSLSVGETTREYELTIAIVELGARTVLGEQSVSFDITSGEEEIARRVMEAMFRVGKQSATSVAAHKRHCKSEFSSVTSKS